MTYSARALIAEDEPLLAEDLRQALARAWPELQIAAMVGDGLSAARQALALQPDVLFFDIRMPGQSGLEAAAELADAWPEAQPFPILVFVTAYDQYAMDAFEAQAVDYLLKPVQPERLARSVQRLRELLAQRTAAPAGAALAQALEQLRHLAGATAPAATATEPPLQMIQAGVGTQIQMVPVHDVVYFEAADKYVRVLTASHEYLVRTPLKELLPRLDAEEFWQVHRGTVVRAAAIASAQRDEAGRLWLQLRERAEKLAVSRLYAQRFKAM
ncbi:response regulator transcription factor [Delftia sp. SD018]|uniref:LytR/AlgR family response regulator transcription factor n=1 Tax=Delftia TaxID=80865 RepID=UPI000F4CD34D|nr:MULTISPECIES: LytTR family DNA-binding domain-containing protein [Delftia]MBO0990772.1 response regulator transcription factor [Delftia sp. SD083]MBO1037595.1 response regulator transcription factor [Delftia sp. SD018]ROR00753.1 LytTR family two component transcriptional regulator [Delftia acidovorans]